LAVEVSDALERARFSEELGVSSSRLQAYIDDVLAAGIELHSVMVLRHGKVAAEIWREPYSAQYPHIMYSVSKSITAIAVGFAVQEGYFAVEDRLIDYFPEYRPKKTDENLEQLKIFNLLTMTSGKFINVFEIKSRYDWVEQYFRAKWSYTPGTSWSYINENQFMLCELVKRTTGKTVVEFLAPRLFEPLGFNRVPVWETSGDGTESGGWGLFLKTEELAKLAQCLLDGGLWHGKQLIPAEWAKKMLSKVVDNLPTNEAYPDQCHGYGYCMWQNPVPNSARMDGMFGQYAMTFSDYDAVLVTTCNQIDEPLCRSIIWKHFPGVFCEESSSPPRDATVLSMPPLPPPQFAPRRTELENAVNGKTYKIRRAILNNVVVGVPCSVLSTPLVIFSAFKRGNITNVGFDFSEDSCVFRWREDAGNMHSPNDCHVDNAVTVGLDGEARISEATIANTSYRMNCWGFWCDDRTLEIHLRPLESLNDRVLRFRFKRNGKIRLIPDLDPKLLPLLDQMLDIFMLPYLPMPKLTKPGLGIILPLLCAIAEPALGGREIKG
jgi:CubicO group peptidase (beta-lactamase class C family)